MTNETNLKKVEMACYNPNNSKSYHLFGTRNGKRKFKFNYLTKDHSKHNILACVSSRSCSFYRKKLASSNTIKY